VCPPSSIHKQQRASIFCPSSSYPVPSLISEEENGPEPFLEAAARVPPNILCRQMGFIALLNLE